MTVNIPQKAGFVATTKEWDDLVRIAENLAAQVVQRDAELRQMQAERDAARAEVARLRTVLENIAAEVDGSVGGVIARAALRQPAPAQGQE